MSEGLFGGWIGEKPTGSAGLQTIVQEFTYLSPPTIDFGSLLPNDLIIETRIEIDTAFDDPAATVSIGPVSNPDSLLATNQTNPNLACDYTTHEGLKITSNDSMRLKVAPGTSTQGAGRAIIIFRR